MSGYQLASDLLKALAHPVRLQILRLLELEGEACVCHLEAHLQQRQAYISQQLAKLREVGLVKDRRDGLNVYYALVDDQTAAAELLERILAYIADSEHGPKDSGELELPMTVEMVDCPCPKCSDLGPVATQPIEFVESETNRSKESI